MEKIYQQENCRAHQSNSDQNHIENVGVRKLILGLFFLQKQFFFTLHFSIFLLQFIPLFLTYDYL